MIRGFYTAVSGIKSQQSGMDAIANNIANISTTGYKAQHAAFSSLLYKSINGGSGGIAMGHGARISGTDLTLSQGDLTATGQAYDFAVDGEGFFALQGADKNDRVYTRDGSFQLSQSGDKMYLGDGSGRFVVDRDGQRIEVGEAFDATKIAVFNFPNPYALSPAGGNVYRETPASGKAEALTSPEVRRGYLESSSVQASGEMVRMIETSKAFSLNSRVVQTADELEKVINQLR